MDTVRRGKNSKRPDESPAGPRALRVAGYVRCSTEEQSAHTDYNTLDNQKALISGHVEMKVGTGEPWELVGFYIDDGYSGKNMERPELARLLTDIRGGSIDAVVVYKLDRITRSLPDFFEMDRLMGENGCALVSVKEQFDTTAPLGRLMRNLLLVFAEMEREMNSERVKDKMMAEARQGRFLGGNLPYGYRAEDRHLVVVPEEAQVVRLMFEKYIETRSIACVRDTLYALGFRTRPRPWKGQLRPAGRWTSQAVEKVLRNPKYAGVYTFAGIEIPNSHEAIVPEELFDRAQQVATLYHRKPPADSGEAWEGHTYLLQGLVECPHCDVLMTPQSVQHSRGHRRHKRYTPYYECGHPHKLPGDTCPVGRYNAESLEGAILDELDRLITEPELLERIMATLEEREQDAAARERLEQVRAAMKPVRTQVENLVEAVANGADLLSLKARLVELEGQERALRTEALTLEAVLNRERAHVYTVEDARRWFREARAVLRAGTPEERKVVMRGLVRKVEAKDKETARVTFNVLPAPPEANHKDHGSSLLQPWLAYGGATRTLVRGEWVPRRRVKPRWWMSDRHVI